MIKGSGVMKDYKLIIFLIIAVLAFSNIILAESLKINEQSINFNIEPEKIEQDSYLPIEQLKELNDISLYKIEDKKVLIIYKSNYFAFAIDSKLINTNQGNKEICCSPIKINNHILVPIDLLELIFGSDLVIDNDNNNNIELNIDLNQVQFNNQEKLNVKIIIHNNSEKEMSLQFNTSQVYNIFIKNKQNEVIYNWAQNKMFTQSFTTKIIDAKSKIELQEEINITNLKIGTYYLEVQIVANNIDIENEKLKFEVL